MIKYVHYIAVSAFFILVLILFLLFSPDSHSLNMVTDSDFIITKNTGDNLENNAKIAVITGNDTDSPEIESIISTLSFLRYGYTVRDSVYDSGSASIIIYASDNVTETDITALKAFLAHGGSVIFAVMPDNMTEELMSLLEIAEYTPNYEMEGFDIYDGILLGGMFRVNDLAINCAKVKLTGRCKVYANGHNPNRDKSLWVIDREYENPLVWRTYYEGGTIFVMNAPFMEDLSGAGVLTGVLSLVYGDFIYPVVGTKSVVLNNFPFLSNDYKTINNRTPYVFARDIMWPNLYSLSKRIDITYTCFVNSDTYLDAKALDSMSFFTNELYKANGSQIGYGQSNIKYDDMTVVIEDTWNGAFEWISDDTVKLPIISRETEMTDDAAFERKYFKFLSLLSAMGIVVHEIDITPVFTGDMAWNDYYNEISQYCTYLFEQCEFLKHSTLRDASESVKNYLNLDMTVSHAEKSITVSTTRSVGETVFILRTEKTIDTARCVNCTVSEIERGVYMAKSTDSEFIIFLK